MVSSIASQSSPKPKPGQIPRSRQPTTMLNRRQFFVHHQLSSAIHLLLVFQLLLLTTVLQSNAQNNNNGGGGLMQVKITKLPVEVSRANAESTVQLRAPFSKTPIYCVGTQGLSNLRFICEDCNNTVVAGWIRSATKNIQSSVQFPAIQLTNVQLNKTMNGKTLQCEGAYNDPVTQQASIARARASMNILYLDRPQITNMRGEPAVQTPQGNRFYVQRGGGSTSLKCQADGNPAATKWEWTQDGKVINNGQQMSIGQNMIGSSIQCGANNGFYPSVLESLAVKISPWDTPKLLSNNFQTVQQQNSGSFVGGKVKIGSNIRLQCIVSGNPKPTVKWLLQNNARTSSSVNNQNYNGIFNATCVPRITLLASPGQIYTPNNNNNNNNNQNQQQSNTVYVVKSECTLNVMDYTAMGSYWCSACNQVSATSLHCQPSQTSLPSQNVAVGVTGKPMQGQALPNAVQDPNNGAIVSVYYCSDPAPRPQNIYWQIGQGGGSNVQKLTMNNQYQHFKAENPVLNGTSCYTARLRIQPVTESDLDQSVAFFVANSDGNLQIPVNLKQLLTGETPISEAADVGLIVGLTVGLVVLLLIVIGAIIVCCCLGLLCFSSRRKKDKEQPEKPARSNVAPEQVRSSQQPPHSSLRSTAANPGNANNNSGSYNVSDNAQNYQPQNGHNNYQPDSYQQAVNRSHQSNASSTPQVEPRMSSV